MINDIEKNFDDIEEKIRSDYFIKVPDNVEEWKGADVIISAHINKELKKWRDQDNLVISTQQIQPRRRLIITEYSKELSSLFMQLKSIFQGELDYISKYDFYGTLAQAAIVYLDNNDNIECNDLLLNVLDAARGFSNAIT